MSRDPLSREEQERRRHIRHWARFMIVHLDRSEFDARHYSYAGALLRLRELIDRELARTRGDADEVRSAGARTRGSDRPSSAAEVVA